MKVRELLSNYISYTLLISAGAFFFLVTNAVNAQTIDPDLRPDLQRALAARPDTFGNRGKERANGYLPAQARRSERPAESVNAPRRDATNARTLASSLSRPSSALNIPATSSIKAGTPLTQILHTAQVSLVSSAGTDEQFVDRN